MPPEKQRCDLLRSKCSVRHDGDERQHHSSYREILIEHLFVGEIMRRLWLRGFTQFEVLKPQVNDSGYDLVLEANGVARHVQLKSSFNAAATGQVKASLKLALKPSACVIWVRFDPSTVTLGPFLWFGASPGQPIPDFSGFKVFRHTRANAQGIKKERPNQRSIPRARFERIENFDALVTRLFGEFTKSSPDRAIETAAMIDRYSEMTRSRAGGGGARQHHD